MENINLYLEIASSLTALLGIPVAIYIYLQEKKRERKEREYGTYNSLDDKYIEFLNLCLNNTDLDIYHIEKFSNKKRTAEQNNREIIIFEILISILERAFLMYRDQSSKIKQEQWVGWVMYMEDWLKRENFQKAWKKLGYQWDDNFEKHMNEIYERVKAVPPHKSEGVQTP